MENPSEWMTATEARLILGIGKAKLAEWLKDGTLPSVKNPFDKRVLMVNRADVDRLNAIPRPKIGTAAA
jgi:predicted site-specific integrase-resolvase